MAGSKDIFPLPVLEHCKLGFPFQGFFMATIRGLNSLYGVSSGGDGERTSPAAHMVLKRLESVLENSPLLKTELVGLDFKTFFDSRGLDYSGEEVRLAQKVSWASIEPSFPPEVGALDIREFCEGGVLHFVNHIEDTILPVDEQFVGKAPSVMVHDELWEELASNLVSRGLCDVVHESSLHHVGHSVLLNGLFAVGKDEVKNGIPVTRLIMNLKPWNAISRALAGDVGTLPMVTSMGALHIHDNEVLLTSSEDLRCFFYLFRVPQAWVRFMGFGKKIPLSMVPQGSQDNNWYLAGKVLPMGYLNSVGVAQHIHRCVITRALGSLRNLGEEIQELRRDRCFSSLPSVFRVYLDNFDQLQRVDRKLALTLSGSPSPVVEQVREYYAQHGLPRHPKKSVEQALEAEVQGAWLDGKAGTMCAKPAKVVKYMELALEILCRGKASQREMQVVGGGLVYAAMFKRPLLSCLNQMWRFITACDQHSAFKRFWLPRELMVELFRFMSLLPLAAMNFRCPFDSEVTASDASSSGGGVCVSRGVSSYGLAASLSQVRGDIPEDLALTQVLCIGLFDGIAALRVGLDALGVAVCGHISVEKNAQARRVVEANFPDCIQVDDIEEVTEQMVQDWGLKFSSAGLVLLGAGPPCQGVSGLNSDRKGALRDLRSRLFLHVPRVRDLVKKVFVWAQVQSLYENVASMDASDCELMNEAFGLLPWFVDADGISLAHRPRLYWVSWELYEQPGVEIYLGTDGKLPIQGQVVLQAEFQENQFLEKGWRRVSTKALPTFTTSRPSSTPLRRPAGLKDCNKDELARWKEARHRFPPYQFKDCHCLQNHEGRLRPPNVVEREVIMGFPAGYTNQCFGKALQGTLDHEDCRLTLVGNSWHVGVIAWLLSQLLVPLGLTSPLSLQDIVDRLAPGGSPVLQGLLLRPPLMNDTKTFHPSERLVAKICGLTSLKGEDILLQNPSEIPVRYHRLRSSLPAKLWRWRTVTGWQWSGNPEHINVLEARAVLTTIKWRILQRKQCNIRCLHLVDSLVVLHALTRGRTSSRKMRSTIMRINAYLLASGLQPLWGFVDTKQNPADKPSRWNVKKKWLKRWVLKNTTATRNVGNKSANN